MEIRMLISIAGLLTGGVRASYLRSRSSLAALSFSPTDHLNWNQEPKQFESKHNLIAYLPALYASGKGRRNLPSGG